MQIHCKQPIFYGLNISQFRSKLKFLNFSQVLIFARRCNPTVDSNEFEFDRIVHGTYFLQFEGDLQNEVVYSI